jgi:L-rhamnose mutarotase
LSITETYEELKNALTTQSSISPTTIFSQHNEDQTFKSLKVDDEKSKARQVPSEPFNKGIIQ